MAVSKKGVWNSILSRRIKYYTKEVLKLINLITIGAFAILMVALIKYKPVYRVTVEEEVGYIANRYEFEKKN